MFLSQLCTYPLEVSVSRHPVVVVRMFMFQFKFVTRQWWFVCLSSRSSLSPGSGGSYVQVPAKCSCNVQVKEVGVVPLWWECSEMCPIPLFFRCVNFCCECNRPVCSVCALVKRSLVHVAYPGALSILSFYASSRRRQLLCFAGKRTPRPTGPFTGRASCSLQVRSSSYCCDSCGHFLYPCVCMAGKVGSLGAGVPGIMYPSARKFTSQILQNTVLRFVYSYIFVGINHSTGIGITIVGIVMVYLTL